MSSKHGTSHRARWTDEHGRRQSRCFRYKRDASLFEMRKKAEVEEIKAGLRAEKPAEHTGNELFDLWKEKRAPRKRSCKDDESIIETSFGDIKVHEIDVEAHEGQFDGSSRGTVRAETSWSRRKPGS